MRNYNPSSKKTRTYDFDALAYDDDWIYIEDIGGNAGLSTVTNHRQEVLNDLAEFRDDWLATRRVFYKDTDGEIDEIVHENGRFVAFRSGRQSPDMLARIREVII